MKTVEELLAIIEEGLKNRVLPDRSPANLYRAMNHLLPLKAKRVRPLLVLLSHQLYNPETVEKALPIALAVELFHNFTLVHDDLMDNSPTRRGKPTVHTIFGNNMAILAGDAMFAHTWHLLTEPFPERAGLLVQTFSKIALEVCEGQARDMELPDKFKPTTEDYLEMIRQKTAVLLGGALVLGAIGAGNTSTEELNLLDEIGQSTGIAFQLQDDYLDIFGTEAETGKQVAGDILENKKTWLWISAYQRANRYQREQLDNWTLVVDQPQEKIAGVKEIFIATRVHESIQEEIYKHHTAAANKLNFIGQRYDTSLLAGVFNKLMGRIS